MCGPRVLLDVQEVLGEVPADVDTLVFPNYESLPERDDVEDPFLEVTLFKKNYAHVVSGGRPCLLDLLASAAAVQPKTVTMLQRHLCLSASLGPPLLDVPHVQTCTSSRMAPWRVATPTTSSLTGMESQVCAEVDIAGRLSTKWLVCYDGAQVLN